MQVGDLIDITLERMRTDDDKQAVVGVNAPIASGFAVDTMELATPTGAASDTDLRVWESLGHRTAVPSDWSSESERPPA